jgi:hypothetical protein
MHRENLRFLYREYKNCLKNEFSEYFGKDDEYKSYADKCHNQKSDISNYIESYLSKIDLIDPDREEKEVLAKYYEKLKSFNAYGWSENEIKN